MPDQVRFPAGRAALLALPGLALLAGLNAALLLLDLPAPVDVQRLPDVHGVLLVLGFAGALVALERAVALRRAWGYLAPAGMGAGGLLLLSPLPLAAGGWLLVTGTLALGAVYLGLWRRQPAAAVTVQAGGAVLAAGAALLWVAAVPVSSMLPWLAGFLVLTIAGERMELSRIGSLDPRAEAAATLLSSALVAGAVASLLWPAVGTALFGGTLLALVGWLVRYDVARHTIGSTGLPRFTAGCLLAGYAWLAVAAAVWLLAGPELRGGAYDAAVHAVFLGFVISMIMAHAPVILPAVLRRRLPYHRAMVAPAVLLHASLLLRTTAGDARGIDWAWQWGGLLNIVAVLAFVAISVWSVATAARPGPHVPVPTSEPHVEAAR
ncbi:MAG TPA: hypothetical protein VFZ37_16940 [Jiangellaceae bacterium]